MLCSVRHRVFLKVPDQNLSEARTKREVVSTWAEASAGERLSILEVNAVHAGRLQGIYRNNLDIATLMADHAIFLVFWCLTYKSDWAKSVLRPSVDMVQHAARQKLYVSAFFASVREEDAWVVLVVAQDIDLIEVRRDFSHQLNALSLVIIELDIFNVALRSSNNAFIVLVIHLSGCDWFISLDA